MTTPVLFSDLDERATQNGLTDVYAAEIFVARHGEDWRYDHTKKEWRTFEHPTWRQEKPGEIRRLLIDCARVFQRRAEELPIGSAREKLTSWAKFCQNDNGLRRIENVARSLKPIAVNQSAWNHNPWLMAASNAVIDLKTGGVVPNSREQHITMALKTPFDPTAKCPRWRDFLFQIFEDQQVVAYMWRMLGYLLTGNTSAQVWWLWYGEGANGKTTLANTIAHILGEYGATVPFSMFQLQQQRSGIPDDLATLPGKRFIHAAETIEGKRIDEARMKMLTGSDRIAARPLFGRWFEFEPTHKVVLSCNHRPVVQDDSPGFWRRVHLVPFTQRFDGANRDDHLEEKLRAEAPGILAWMVAGCLEWQKRGLQPPSAVVEATLGYRSESDHLAEFFADRCETREGVECGASALFDNYRTWAIGQQIPNNQIHGQRSFGERTVKRFPREERRTGRVYVGVGLRRESTAA